MIAEAATSDVQNIIGLIKESQELTVRDVLPYLSDSMTIDAFKNEICDCLDTYEGGNWGDSTEEWYEVATDSCSDLANGPLALVGWYGNDLPLQSELASSRHP